ncbi:MAG TPA: hypothetical protein VK927_00350 [Adhaeribacter sp.]|nr:hypothetical protein [Adhaeribacter sp.]
MENKHLFLVTTTSGQTIDLTQAKEIRSNNLYPFGRHNYAVYAAPNSFYVLGTNQHSPEHMLDTFELVDQETALQYKHPFVRED